MKAKSNILIISDMCGYGKVSAAVQMPILLYGTRRVQSAHHAHQ